VLDRDAELLRDDRAGDLVARRQRRERVGERAGVLVLAAEGGVGIGLDDLAGAVDRDGLRDAGALAADGEGDERHG
jgi:hypothetical protein